MYYRIQTTNMYNRIQTISREGLSLIRHSVRFPRGYFFFLPSLIIFLFGSKNISLHPGGSLPRNSLVSISVQKFAHYAFCKCFNQGRESFANSTTGVTIFRISVTTQFLQNTKWIKVYKQGTLGIYLWNRWARVKRHLVTILVKEPTGDHKLDLARLLQRPIKR